MTPGGAARHALSKPGAWPDQPWEGDYVAKVAEAGRQDLRVPRRRRRRREVRYDP